MNDFAIKKTGDPSSTSRKWQAAYKKNTKKVRRQHDKKMISTEENYPGGNTNVSRRDYILSVWP